MPIYEYECPACGRFEVIQKVDEAQKSAALSCQTEGCSEMATRLISPAAFHLKGSGWYKTDYAGGKNSSSANGNGAKSSANETDPKASSSESSSKTESASEAKTAKPCGTACGCH